MRRIRRLILLATVFVAATAGVGLGASPAEARDPGPGGGCRLVEPSIDANGRIRVIECYY
ncbi:MAG TPA: hypothetical protein VNB24_08890 [Acidimicrobiales bacterium]|nr:hypothetical protein [Acidimicrobiales bacterium]